MPLIVIEGLDGSGKSTQVKKICNYLRDTSISYEFLHFPRLEDPFFGILISRFLRGEFGSLHSVDPYLVAMLYAADRWHASHHINQWLSEGKVVLLDRYVYSNVAYQVSKVTDETEKEKLRKWIIALEYEVFKIPRPDINIWLEAPISFVATNLSNHREGEDRSYLQNTKDIHEADLEFQKRVHAEYFHCIQNFLDVVRISCYDKSEKMLSESEIFSRILEKISPFLVNH